jgi:hypothetical protein
VTAWVAFFALVAVFAILAAGACAGLDSLPKDEEEEA